MVPYRLVSSKAELLGNHQGLAEVVSPHLASKEPEAPNHSTGPLFAERSVGHRGITTIFSPVFTVLSTQQVVAAAAHSLGGLGEVGGRYADHVAALIRRPNASVRLAAVEARELLATWIKMGSWVSWYDPEQPDPDEIVRSYSMVGL